jgi:hypothetical protein
LLRASRPDILLSTLAFAPQTGADIFAADKALGYISRLHGQPRDTPPQEFAVFRQTETGRQYRFGTLHYAHLPVLQRPIIWSP